MREIKFRGKRKDIGWKYGYLTIIEKAHEANLIAIKPLDEEWITYGVDPESVGEFTGLQDKNGVEEYQGDLLRWHGKVFQIKWDDRAAMFYAEAADGTSCGFPLEGEEIIDNIYENPELLKEE